MNTREAAAALDVTPKALRRHLRSHHEWKSAGIGGTYAFTPRDIQRLKAQLKPSTPADDGYDWMNTDPGVDVEIMQRAKGDPHLRGRLRAQRRARQRKLGEQLLATSIINRRVFERYYS